MEARPYVFLKTPSEVKEEKSTQLDNLPFHVDNDDGIKSENRYSSTEESINDN
jgi:hypothetical protein